MLIAVGWSLILWLIVNSCIRYPPRTDEPENLRPQKCWLNCPSHLSHLSDQRALIDCCCSVHRPKSDPLWPTKAVSPVYCWQDIWIARQYLVNSSFLVTGAKGVREGFPPCFCYSREPNYFSEGEHREFARRSWHFRGEPNPNEKSQGNSGLTSRTFSGLENFIAGKYQVLRVGYVNKASSSWLRPWLKYPTFEPLFQAPSTTSELPRPYLKGPTGQLLLSTWFERSSGWLLWRKVFN